jgi:VIT1/CCC1 family predicted Fe2+/Mn2+ transporter
MTLKDQKIRLWKEVREEARQDEEQEVRIELRLRKWMRAAISLGVGVIVSIGAVVPFLYGYPLHDQWNAVGKTILVLSMCLFVAFMYAAGITYTCWSYLKGVKEIHKKFAPPGSKYRMGKQDD